MRDLDRARFGTEQLDRLRTFEGEAPRAGPGPVTVSRAVAANNRWARSLGWGCVINGRVRAMLEVRVVLGLRCAADESETELAAAVARWQRGQGLPSTGELDTTTWERMRPLIREPRPGSFQARQWTVRHGGVELGVIDKIGPYQTFYVDAAGRKHFGPRPTDAERGGVELQLAFRTTNGEGVRRAGFERFRWVQVVEFNWDLNSLGTLVRKAGRAVDPTPRSTPRHLTDAHPYYWHEVVPAGAQWLLDVNCYLWRPVPGRRHCYNLRFGDAPEAPLSLAQPRHRYWANYELALVGVRPGSPPSGRTRNLVLTTLTWGYDIIVHEGIPIVKINSLAEGKPGGSAEFKRTLNQEMARGGYPTHCFPGSGWGSGVRCR